ncbi:MAG: hypothetical protein HZC55_14430 [Verrucomicrobia bacterium]|nr:hypothetical protein [Verrucomicrobiota bacterium]
MSEPPQHGRLVGRLFRVLAALCLLGGAARAEPAAPLRVGLVLPDPGPTPAVTALTAAIATATGATFETLRLSPATSRAALTKGPRPVDALLILGGPGPLAGDELAALRELLGATRGLLVLGAVPESWPADPGFFREVVGAESAGSFANGAPMSVINLFAHPVFFGIGQFEAAGGFPSWSKLADDVEILMEGTVGEDTTPLAWVRRASSRRLCHLVPAAAAQFADPAYQRLAAQALLWVCRRAIPGAVPIVQRTFMPDSYPGSFAITFPEGPGVCLDPVRGGINFIWDGDFVDLRPRWLTKQGAPARVVGERFYEEKSWQPLRSGTPKGEAGLKFRGFAFRNGQPEFHYEIDGREVRETLRALPAGAGISREFHVGPGTRALWLTLDPQSASEVATRGLQRDGPHARFAAPEGGSFTIEIRRRSGGGTAP